jgi:hypothetical protein
MGSHSHCEYTLFWACTIRVRAITAKQEMYERMVNQGTRSVELAYACRGLYAAKMRNERINGSSDSMSPLRPGLVNERAGCARERARRLAKSRSAVGSTSGSSELDPSSHQKCRT